MRDRCGHGCKLVAGGPTFETIMHGNAEDMS
jgi:hypothetical protein